MIIKIEKETDKNKLKRFNLLYNFNLYKLICKNKTLSLIIEKITLSNLYTDITIHISPLYMIWDNQYHNFWNLISCAINQYINQTNKKYIYIQTKNKKLCNVLIKNNFKLQKESIYKNLYCYAKNIKEDII